MQIIGLDQEEVRAAAQEVYKDSYIAMDSCDLFLSDIEKGKIQMKCIDHPVYVSTHYAYEDKSIHGNQTRFKISLTAFFVKKHKYETIYDSYGKFFIAYKDQETIKFLAYEDMNDFLKDQIQSLEES